MLFGNKSLKQNNMSATIELKYFNTFWLKRMINISQATTSDSFSNINTPEAGAINPTFNNPLIPENLPLSFTYGTNGENTKIVAADSTKDWVIEESRIRGGYNNQSVDFGVKAYLVEDETRQTHRASGLIHSGIFNSRTGINQTNQFSITINSKRFRVFTYSIFQQTDLFKSFMLKIRTL